MATVYLVARPKGQFGRSAKIEDYAAEDNFDNELGIFQSQHEAMDWAKAHGHKLLVPRIPHLNDKKRPYHWRPAS